MFKNKKVLGGSLLICLLVSIFIFIFGATFLPKYDKNKEQSNRITTVYTNSKIDFIIPSPSEQQVQEMKAMEHVNGVFACYSLYSEFVFNGKSIDESVLLVEDVSDLENTMFKQDRLLKKNGAFRDQSLLIDETFASQHKLSLGSEVVWHLSDTETVTLVVDAIYYENVLDSVRVVVFNAGVQKAVIDRYTANNPLKISKAYIDSSNLELTNEVLKTYQPLGMLKSPEDFSLLIDYENYLKDFNSRDYYRQIVQTEAYKIENASIAKKYQKDANSSVAIYLALSAVISLVVSLGGSLVMGIARSIISQIREGKSKWKVCLVFAVYSMLAVVIIAACALVTVLFNIQAGASIAGIAALLMFLSGSVNAVVQILIVNQAIKVKKQ